MEVAGERVPDDELGGLIARGRDAEVFALGEDRVVRRTTAPDRDLHAEAQVMEHVRAAGYPVPRVWRIAPGEMVLDRIDGPTMLDDVADHPWRVAAQGRLLAELHSRLHAIEAPAGLRAHPWEGTTLVHLDLHPANVILSPDGPVVIDWTNARRGGGEADLADVWIVVACLGTEPEPHPTIVRRIVTRVEPFVRRRLLTAFLADGRRDAARTALPTVAEIRLRDPNLSASEKQRVEALVAAEST